MRWEEVKPDYQTITAGVAVISIGLLAFLLFFPVRVFDTEFEVRKGDGLNDIAQVLKDVGLTRSKVAFVAYARLTGKSDELKAGRYLISEPVNVSQVLTILTKGLTQSDDIVILVPEGSNVWEIDEILAKVGLTGTGQFAERFYLDEGYLFPDTYRFPDPAKKHISIEEIRQKFMDNFKSKADRVSKEELIIASILEKEAKTEEDVRFVAGIIEKRMELGMLLQIDATVAYGACVRTSIIRNCDVTQIGVANEITVDGPYNTYIRKGLPPGPISNPGLKAIRAAQNPRKSDYLYYLSTRDGSQLVYSKTLAEHEANRRKYLGI